MNTSRQIWMIIIVVVLSSFIVIGVNEAFSSNDSIRDSLPKRWLTYSQHALQRMEERRVTSEQVTRTVKYGQVNVSKSQPTAKYAVELSEKGRYIRVVVAPFLWWFATVVTVIDIGV